MSPPPQPLGAVSRINHHILIVDDNQAIHADFRKILGGDFTDNAFDAAEAEFFGKTTLQAQPTRFEMDFAFQGEEALQRVQTAGATGYRYAMVFMDVRMPPGWDGLETTLKLWEADPDIQIVLCTAHSDYTWGEIVKAIGSPDRLLILKKPFDPIEVLQLAHALTEKWSLLRAMRSHTAALESTANERTYELHGITALLEAEIARRKAEAVQIRSTPLLKPDGASPLSKRQEIAEAASITGSALHEVALNQPGSGASQTAVLGEADVQMATRGTLNL